MYIQWIQPIKEQLNRRERRYEQLATPGTAPLQPTIPKSAWSTLAQSSSLNTAPSPTPSFSAASSPAMQLFSDFPSASDDVLDDESGDSSGICVCVNWCVFVDSHLFTVYSYGTYVYMSL